MTPLELEVLIHCYYSPELHPRFTAPSVEAAYESHIKAELIKPVKEYFTATEKGKAHIAQILALPLPKTGWVDKHGEIIVFNL